MLELDPAKRISATDALLSDWLKDIKEESIQPIQLVHCSLLSNSLFRPCLGWHLHKIVMKCGAKNINDYHDVVGVKMKSKRISKNVKSLNINDTIKSLVGELIRHDIHK